MDIERNDSPLADNVGDAKNIADERTGNND